MKQYRIHTINGVMSMFKNIADSRENRIILGKHIEQNLRIYQVLIGLIALFECIFLVRGLIVFSWQSYKHYVYFFSYIFLFTISIAMLAFLVFYHLDKDEYKACDIAMRIYTCSIVMWSVIVSFMDMRSGNFPVVYLTVIVTLASVIIVNPRFYIVLCACSTTLLVALDSIGGFHYFISSGEFINVSVLIIMAIIINRQIYTSAVKDFRYNELLNASVLEERNRVSAISMQTILSISNAVDAKDSYTQEHSKRVSEYSVMIAKKLGFDDKRCEEIRQIALLHDIGKIAVSDAILNKPDKLTDDEYEVMKGHTTSGGQILKDLTIIDNVSLGAMHHHERYDGTGYPDGLSGDDIPLEARIIAVADAFDAMNSNRIYRKSLTRETILSELENGKGKQFDPKIVDLFMDDAIRITGESA